MAEKKKAINQQSFLLRTFRFLKRLFLFLFIAQVIDIILLKWVNPPNTITQ